MDIKINVWSRSFFNLEINSICRLSYYLFDIRSETVPGQGLKGHFFIRKMKFLGRMRLFSFWPFPAILGCTIYYKIDIFGKEKSGCVFAEYYLFKPTIFIQNFIYIHFRIILTQFYINFSRQEHQIELLWVLSRSISKMLRFQPIPLFNFSFTVPLKN